MAHTPSGLILMATGGGSSIWMYKTTDTHASVDTAGYFNNEAVKMLKVGDIVFVMVFTSTAFTTLSTFAMHVVTDNDGTTVDISDRQGAGGSTFGATIMDTD